MQPHYSWIGASWPAPGGVQALTTTREGGPPANPDMNVGLQGDGPWNAVAAGRRHLQLATVGEAGRLQWLTQVHGRRCFHADRRSCRIEPEADAIWTTERGVGLAIQTADCAPIVLASRDGARIGAAHGGWRGLTGGVVEQLVAAMQQPEGTGDRLGEPGAELLAWIGPAIGPDAYEVGLDVHTAVLASTDAALETTLLRVGDNPGKWHLDLFALAEWLLRRAGVTQIHCERLCTWSNPNFHSHRRDGAAGRMATVVWMEAAQR